MDNPATFIFAVIGGHHSMTGVQDTRDKRVERKKAWLESREGGQALTRRALVTQTRYQVTSKNQFPLPTKSLARGFN